MHHPARMQAIGEPAARQHAHCAGNAKGRQYNTQLLAAPACGQDQPRKRHQVERIAHHRDRLPAKEQPEIAYFQGAARHGFLLFVRMQHALFWLYFNRGPCIVMRLVHTTFSPLSSFSSLDLASLSVALCRESALRVGRGLDVIRASLGTHGVWAPAAAHLILLTGD